MKRFAFLFACLSALPLAAFAHGPGYGGYGYGGYGYGGGYGVSRNGPPSPAAQMQQQQSDAFNARANQYNQPSPALRYQQAPPAQRYDSLPSPSTQPLLQPYQPSPESERHPFVEEHYPAPPLWQRGPHWMWERGP